MTKSIAISDFIRVAANTYLCSGIPEYKKSTYSCNTISWLCDDVNDNRFSSTIKGIIFNAMVECGMSDPHAAYFKEFDVISDRQSARYIWLMFIAEYLEHIRIDVSPAAYEKFNLIRRKLK